MTAQKEKVIPAKYIPDVGSYIETIDGKDYLIDNDAMYTFYKRTKGEFSAFFLALRDEKRLLGCKCSKCALVRVPPFLTHCPDCNFAPTELTNSVNIDCHEKCYDRKINIRENSRKFLKIIEN